MRKISATAALATVLFASPENTAAMNNEGHDDNWMATIPQAQAFMDAIAHAKPLPSRRCPVTLEMVKANPYEQIPLPRHGCGPEGASSADPGARLRLTIVPGE